VGESEENQIVGLVHAASS